MSQNFYSIFTATAAGLALVVAIGIAIYQRRRKSLEYWQWISPIVANPTDVVGYQPFVTQTEEHEADRLDRLKILYDGKEVSSLFHCILFFRNNGNVAVAPADYTAPIKVRAPNDETILEAWCLLEPEGLQQIPANTNVLELPRLLINPGEEISVTMLTTSGDAPSIVARIVDAKVSPRPQAEQPKHNPKAKWVLLFALVVGGGTLAFYPGPIDRSIGRLALLAVILCAFGLGIELGKYVWANSAHPRP